jgi:hypothetical protein
MVDLSIGAADIVALAVTAAGAAWLGLWQPPARSRRFSRRLLRRFARHPREQDREAAAPEPKTRPFEVVAAHARRLYARFHQAAEGRSYAKLEAIRRAYDEVLAEGCAQLGIEHLLDVLPPGEELDVERTRVEQRLELVGLDLRLAA